MLTTISIPGITGALTVCWSWPPPWFHNNKLLRGGVVVPTPQPAGPGNTLRLAPTL
jgi:hypothetical protein